MKTIVLGFLPANTVMFVSILTILVLFSIRENFASIENVKFSENYNKNELPPSMNSAPLKVNVSINLRNILEVDERSQFISLETSLKLKWKDIRIQPKLRPEAKAPNTFISFSGQAIDTFWVPDVFIDQAKNIRSPMMQIKPATLRLYSDSSLRYSSRINFDVSCNMDFRNYPVDEQICEIKIESFGFTSDQLEFSWVPNDSNINPNITLDQFNPNVILQSSYSTNYYSKSYPGVILRIYLRRKIHYHLVQTYLPSILFVIISWLSMLINPEAIPGRVSMVMMTLLTLMAMFSGVRQNTPKVSYVSLLDVWMVTCMFFIFLVLVEFSVVTALIRKKKLKQADTIEAISFYVIPIIFVVFNLVYWLTLYFQP